MPWRRKQPAKHCLVTWGNHDFGGQHLASVAPEPIVTIGDDTRIVVDALVEYEGLKIWLSPWSHIFMDWAFMKEEEGLAESYKMIPRGIDILVSHDPPHGYGDLVCGVHDDDCPLRWHLSGDPDKCTCGCAAHIGGKALLNTVDRVKPNVVICGHIHGGHGMYEIERWATREAPTFGGETPISQTTIYNVSVVDEQYKLVHGATEIEV